MSDVHHHLDQWELRPDGDEIHGSHAVVLPVRTSGGASAVLKVGQADHEHLVLRRWNGDGAVRLLRADPHRRALLLERRLRLHVPAMPQLPKLGSCVQQWSEDFASLPRNAAVPHRLVEQAITLCRDLAREPSDHVLHGDLHYGKALTADRAPWLAISPRPVNGDPHFELAPILWHRWDEIVDDIRFGVQRRFYALVEAAGFDEDRARAWVIVRVVREAIQDPGNLTKYIALAKAVQD